MRIDILTLFPEMVDNALKESIIGRGREAGLIDIRCHHIRDYATDKRRRTDDYPSGGGQGMVMQCEPLARCLEDVKEGKQVHTILMSPAGGRFDQAKARELLEREHIILVCGTMRAWTAGSWTPASTKNCPSATSSSPAASWPPW